jgi:two-component system, cell cycle sensor histidine kinase and response regulator CckA
VLNARDAMPNGGRLCVCAHNVREPAENEPGRARATDEWVVLSVSDSGSGMDAETRARMFEPFFTTKPRGTGLGLFTVQQIAREYHGRLEVTSELGRGTRVELRLAAVRPAAESAKPERAGVMSRGSEALLVVEDEDAVRVLVVELLAQLGYQVKAAANAAEALAWLDQEPGGIDLLLTDVVMPGLSGWELASAVVARCPGCRVLYMSGHALGMEDDTRTRVLHGELLHKPFTPEILAARVRQALDRPPPSARSR